MTSRAIPEATPPEPTSATLEGGLELGRALRAHHGHHPPRLTRLPFLGLRASRSVPGAARGMLPPGLPWTIGLSPREAALLEAWQRESSERELPPHEATAPSLDEPGLPLPGFMPPPLARSLAHLERAEVPLVVGTRVPSRPASSGPPRSAAPPHELPARASLAPAFAGSGAVPDARPSEAPDAPPPLVVGSRAPSRPASSGPPRSVAPPHELPARVSLAPAFAGSGAVPDAGPSEAPDSPPPLVVDTRALSRPASSGHPRSATPPHELPARVSPAPATPGASLPLPRLEGQRLPGQSSGSPLPLAVGLAEAVQGLVEGTVSRAMEEAARRSPPPPPPTPPAAPPPVDVSSDTFVRGLAIRLHALAQEERFRGGLIR